MCPDKLKYQFTENFKLKVSDKCCFQLKKLPAQEWSEKNNRPIHITGIRHGEGGLRQSVQGCTIFDDKGLHKFHPLLPLESDWIDEFVKIYKVELCELYKPPYNFERTGCVCCPFSVKLQKQLDILEQFLPTEKKRAELLWKPVYDEYRRIEYRLRPKDLFSETN